MKTVQEYLALMEANKRHDRNLIRCAVQAAQKGDVEELRRTLAVISKAHEEWPFRVV